MAKSLRSKVKRSYRAKKRTEGVYAAADAVRLNRLNAKLSKIAQASASLDDEDTHLDEVESIPVDGEDDVATEPLGQDESGSAFMEVDSSAKRISTHGPRNSRREEWRLSKGLSARPKRHGMNKQGGVAARRKPSRPSRRR